MKFVIGLFVWLTVGILVTLYEIGELNLSTIAWGLLTIAFWPVTVALEFKGRLQSASHNRNQDKVDDEDDA